MNKTNTNKANSVNPELKKAIIREVSITDFLVDTSSSGRVVIRTRVYGNRFHSEWISQCRDVDVLMSVDNFRSYEEFQKEMLGQFAIWPCIPEVEEFEDDSTLRGKVWLSLVLASALECNEVSA